MNNSINRKTDKPSHQVQHAVKKGTVEGTLKKRKPACGIIRAPARSLAEKEESSKNRIPNISRDQRSRANVAGPPVGSTLRPAAHLQLSGCGLDLAAEAR